jgi:hypothetical protein
VSPCESEKFSHAIFAEQTTVSFPTESPKNFESSPYRARLPYRLTLKKFRASDQTRRNQMKRSATFLTASMFAIAMSIPCAALAQAGGVGAEASGGAAGGASVSGSGSMSAPATSGSQSGPASPSYAGGAANGPGSPAYGAGTASGPGNPDDGNGAGSVGGSNPSTTNGNNSNWNPATGGNRGATHSDGNRN